ncbi:hypothetical protein M758_2G031700 [Ceratodon purpureus]|nr:hypothetical protein M758_2G031700 [Ceratodon purpureus]
MGAESAGTTAAPWALRPAQPPSEGFAKLLAARSALCQSLEKSRALGKLLDQSDKRLQTVQERLSPVRRALAPLEEQSKHTEGLAQRIDKTLEPAMSVLSMFDVVSKIRVRLLRDPKDDFDVYMGAVMQLEDAVDYLKQHSVVAVQWLQEAVAYLNETGSTDTVRIRRLNESLATLKSQQAGGAHQLDGGLFVTALGKLEKEFKRLLHEHSHPIDLPDNMESQEGGTPTSSSELDYSFSYPPDVLEKLQSIIGKLVGHPNYQRCIDAYQETRRALCDESMQALDLSYLDDITPTSVNEIPWDELQNLIHIWTQHLEVTVKMLYAGERRLARQVFKYLGEPVWVECLCKLAEPGMTAFVQFGESVAASHRSPEKLCKLLEMFDSMEKCDHSVSLVFDGPACAELRSLYRELLKQVVYAAGKTFWDIDDWIKAQKDSVSQDGKVMQLCSWVVNYLKYVLALFPEALSKVLLIAGSWEGGDKEKGLAQGITQILETLEGLVETRATEFQDPALRHIFLMNNMYYIRNRVKNSDLGQYLGEDLMSEVGRKVSQNALKYQREGWQPVLQHLNREGLTGSSSSKHSRDLVRQRLRAFNGSFDATIEIQSKWIIPEQNLRDGTIAAITQMVVPAYRSFLGQFGSFLETRLRDSDKYIKYSPEMLETILGDLFTGSG